MERKRKAGATWLKKGREETVGSKTGNKREEIEMAEASQSLPSHSTKGLQVSPIFHKSLFIGEFKFYTSKEIPILMFHIMEYVESLQ